MFPCLQKMMKEKTKEIVQFRFVESRVLIQNLICKCKDVTPHNASKVVHYIIFKVMVAKVRETEMFFPSYFHYSVIAVLLPGPGF